MSCPSSVCYTGLCVHCPMFIGSGILSNKADKARHANARQLTRDRARQLQDGEDQSLRGWQRPSQSRLCLALEARASIKTPRGHRRRRRRSAAGAAAAAVGGTPRSTPGRASGRRRHGRAREGRRPTKARAR